MVSKHKVYVKNKKHVVISVPHQHIIVKSFSDLLSEDFTQRLNEPTAVSINQEHRSLPYLNQHIIGMLCCGLLPEDLYQRLNEPTAVPGVPERNVTCRYKVPVYMTVNEI